jgi:hypothetical protein
VLVKTQDNPAIVSNLLTVNRANDESISAQARGDQATGTPSLGVPGDASVASKLDPRTPQPLTLVPYDPTIASVDAQAGWPGGDRVFGRPLPGAERAAPDGRRARGFDLEGLRLRGADMLASCSPYEQGALERAIDRFLEQLSGSDVRLVPGLAPISNLIPGAVVVAVALAAVETMRRRARDDGDSARATNPAEGVEHSGFPGLPARGRIWALEER